jgi:hypothetical protein
MLEEAKNKIKLYEEFIWCMSVRLQCGDGYSVSEQKALASYIGRVLLKGFVPVRKYDDK